MIRENLGQRLSAGADPVLDIKSKKSQQKAGDEREKHITWKMHIQIQSGEGDQKAYGDQDRSQFWMFSDHDYREDHCGHGVAGRERVVLWIVNEDREPFTYPTGTVPGNQILQNHVSEEYAAQ